VTVITDGVVCAPRAGTLYDVLDLILDRGIVIDAFVRVSLVGIEILKIDARIVVASVDTYLRFAEVCNRLDLEHDATSRTVPELFGGAGAGAAKSAGKAGARKAARSVGSKVKDVLGPGHEDDADSDSGEEEPAPRRRTGERAGSGSHARSRRRGEED
jgi:hypothetical protein